MSTATKPKPMKKAERETLTRWLKSYDRWLWLNARTSYQASELAKADGLAFVNPRRAAILAGKTCEHWKACKVGESVRFMLTGTQWQRLLNWVGQHRTEIIEGGCLTGARVMAHWAGVGFSKHAMREAMRQHDIALPDETPRPAWGGQQPTKADAEAPSAPAANLSPVQRQYQQFKAKYPGYVLLFRMGDFYEAFHEDAELMARVLGVTLTKRVGGDNSTSMAGVPYHAVENYLRRLISAGHKVALCELVEGENKPVREVSRLVTVETLAASA